MRSVRTIRLRRRIVAAAYGVIWAACWAACPDAGWGASADPSRTESVVEVDVAKSMGPLPFLFRSGVAIPYEFALGPSSDLFFEALKPGAVELMPFRDGTFSSLKEFVERLPTLAVTRWASETARRGGRPVISLKETPPWLQEGRRGDAYLRPPKSLPGWADYVEAVVRFYNNQLHLDAEYVMWDEPDHKYFWKGTEADYFNLYRFGVLGARRADPRARVGGPAVSGWTNRGQGSKSDRPMLFNFIRYCAETKVPELGLEKLPIDLIVWHQFDTDSKGNPLLYAIPADQVRGWLKQFGYDPATRLNLGAWNTWTNFGNDPNELSPERDGEFAAAYAVQALDAMDRAGIDEQMFFSLFEQWQWNSLPPARREKEFRDKEFVGGFGLFTRNRIIKPIFNAFHLLSMLDGGRIAASSRDPYLTLMASRSDNTVFLLVGNFVWPSERPMALKARTLLAGGYPRADLAAWSPKISPQMMQEVDAGTRTIDSLPIPESAKRELNALSYVDNFYATRNEPKSVRVSVRALPFSGVAHVGRYLIDARHGNSLRAQEEIKEAFLQAKRKADADVGDLLIQWGGLRPDVNRLDEARRSQTIQAAVARLSPDQRQKVEQRLQQVRDEALDRLNHLPMVQPQRMDEQVAVRAGELNIPVDMTPYSVQLIVLTKSGNAEGRAP